jgi:hypothetical protein
MSKIAISGASTGSATFTIESPATSTNRTLTLPDNTGTIITQNSTPAFASTIGVGGATAAASGAGITFPATQSASSDANTLDDYEQGTWTPSYLPGTGSFSSITYVNQAGSYTKIGNRVFFQGRIRTDSISVGSASGAVYINGLPFTSSNDSNTGRNAGSISLANSYGGDTPTVFFVETNVTFFALQYRTSANGATINLDVTDLGTGGSQNQIFFSGCYDI